MAGSQIQNKYIDVIKWGCPLRIPIPYTLKQPPSDELPAAGIGRHILASDSHKIIQELQKPPGFQIFRADPVNPKSSDST